MSSSSSAPLSQDVRRQIMASAIGSITATMVLNPVGVVKTRAQATNGKFLDIVRNVIKESGMFGFWTGARLGIAQSLPSTVIYMTSYEKLKLLMTTLLPNSASDFTPGVAGGLARSVVVSILAPLELMRTMQLGGAAQSMTVIASTIYATHGVAGFYRGWASTIMRDTPFSIIYWMCFEKLRLFYGPRATALTGAAPESGGMNNIRNGSGVSVAYPPVTNFLSGASSGVIAAIITHPFDVIKTRLQVAQRAALVGTVNVPAGSGSSNGCSNTKRALTVCCEMAECCCPCTGRPLSVVSEAVVAPACPSSAHTGTSSSAAAAVVRKSVKEEILDIVQSRGVRGLYTGLAMRLATIVPGSGIMITVYEFAKTL